MRIVDRRDERENSLNEEMDGRTDYIDGNRWTDGD